MLKLIGWRLASAIPLLIAVTVAVFVMFSFVPVDPTTLILGEAASEEQRAALEAELGIDRPFLVQLLDWVRGALTLDFGDSYLRNRPVGPDLLNRLPVTLSLCLGGLAVAILIGVPVGVICAERPNSLIDRSLTVVVSVLLAMPGFWLALLLVLLFAVELRLVPVIGYVPLTDDPVAWARHLILPWLAMGTSSAATIARQTRSAMLEVLDATFVRAAVARGASRRRAVYVYSLKNAMMPVLAVVGMQFALMISVSFVLERIFTIPGSGTLLLDALLRGDIPMLQAAVLIVAAAIILVNLLVDIGYGLINPKVRPR